MLYPHETGYILSPSLDTEGDLKRYRSAIYIKKAWIEDENEKKVV